MKSTMTTWLTAVFLVIAILGQVVATPPSHTDEMPISESVLADSAITTITHDHDEHEESDCCAVECCENECVCPDNTCSSLAYVQAESIETANRTSSTHAHRSRVDTISNTIPPHYRPPIYTS